MHPITVSINLDAPLQRVWDALSDLENQKNWMGDVDSLTFATDQSQGAGTEMIVATKVGPLRLNDRMLVTAWEPPTRMTVLHQGTVQGTGEFVLAAIGGATRLTWTEDLRFPWRLGGGLTAIASRPILAAVWRQNLKRLRSILAGVPD